MLGNNKVNEWNSNKVDNIVAPPAIEVGSSEMFPTLGGGLGVSGSRNKFKWTRK